MPDQFVNLERLRALMAAAGARRLIAKRLASNDNSKNQIYLGSGFEALNILPFGEIREDSTDRNQILKAPLAFRWLEPDGQIKPAHDAQLILYPQYPELRMSGFLNRTKGAANELMRSRLAGRVMFLGIDESGAITGAVVSPHDALAKEFEAIVAGREERVFHELALGASVPDSKVELLAELKRIHALGWIKSKRLTGDGSIAPCEAPNCGGYTLEAELGVKPNGFSDPDFRGWEVKQYNVSDIVRQTGAGSITLMTPEPTGGLYREEGVETFIRKYGYPDRNGREDRINFGGVHRVGKRVSLTGLTLVPDGYDAAASRFTDSTKGITLLDDKGRAAAIWAYTGLIKHWARKHERAVYVPSASRTEPERQYHYGGSVLLGQETDFIRFLNAMAAGHVYYDPGIKLEESSSANPKLKRRSQFRVRVQRLGALYASTEFFSL
jgi:hypothetical protein